MYDEYRMVKNQNTEHPIILLSPRDAKLHHAP